MKSYSFYSVIKFRDFNEMQQLQIDDYNDIPQNPIEIKSTNSNKGEYEIFTCRYDRKKDKEGYSFFDGEYHNFNHYFTKERFDCLYSSEKAICIFECPYKVSDLMLKEINALESKENNTNSSIRVIKKTVDLLQVVENTHKITGAWFSNINQNHISSSSVYGDEVDQSDLYSQLILSGKLTAVNIVLLHKNDYYLVTISKNGSFTIRNKIDTDTEVYIINQVIKLIFD